MSEIYLMNVQFLEIENNFWNKFLKKLKKNEVEKINYFLLEKQKKLSFASLYLQYTIINLYTNKKHIDIKKTKYGKPYIDKIYYNVSHDKELCGIVVNNHSNVGIDIMSLDRIIDKSVIENVFTSHEINNNKDFLKLWCLKESYLKAIGIGLNYDLKRLEFVIENKILLYIDKILQDEYNFDILNQAHSR